MLSVIKSFLNENTRKDRFTDTYTPIVNHFVSKLQNNSNPESQPDIICDPTPVTESNEKRIKEELVRCIWYGRHLKTGNLLTENEIRVEIISPGWWNVESGPDFHHAEIIFSNTGYKKGDVEVHVYSNDWNKHGHHLQETYNNVSLHVAMWNNTKDDFVYNKNGSSIPQLILSKYLNRELDELFDTINFDKYPDSIKTNVGLCRKSMDIKELSNECVGFFLDSAGDERILTKTKRFSAILDKRTYEQTMYEATMEAMGYKNNKDQFLKLANLLQFKDIQEIAPVDLDYKNKALFVQASLFGMAGLLPSQLKKSSKTEIDEETGAYIQKIENSWTEISGIIDAKPMDGSLWSFSKTRPSNFPTRRIATMSHIITKSLNGGILKLMLGVFEKADSTTNEKDYFKTLKKGFDSIFLELVDDYWSNYYTFNSKRLSNPERLLGKERTSDILINIMIPLLLLNARKNENIELEKSLHLLYRNYPRLASNSVTKFMTNRIFGNENKSDEIVCSSRRQQGLHQIFKDFCDSDNFLCNRCVMYLMLQN